MIRAGLLMLVACAGLAACGVDGAPIPPSRMAHSGPAAAF
jgi:hypothetical protein